MKKTSLRVMLILFSVLLSCIFAACSQIGDGYTKKEKEPTELAYFNEVIKKFATLEIGEAVTFKMGIDDDKEGEIIIPYEIGKNAVTRELWSRVYKWATSISDAENKKIYRFSEKANIGDVSSHNNESMTNVTYMDSVVWCNAFTEYLNYLHKDEKSWTLLFPVYYEYKDEVREAFSEFARTQDGNRRERYFQLLEKYILRDSGEPTSSRNGMEFNEFYGFNGYRLPSTEEWEFASRLTKTQSAAYNTATSVVINGVSYYFLKGACLSGSVYRYDDNTPDAKEANIKVAAGFEALANGSSNSEPPQSPSDSSNDIGCFDMSGGVWEWCLPKSDRHVVLKKSGKVFVLDDDYPTHSNHERGENRIKGGSYASTNRKEYAVGFVGSFPTRADDKHKDKWQKKDVGFRLAKTMHNFF